MTLVRALRSYHVSPNEETDGTTYEYVGREVFLRQNTRRTDR
jgi:hypothetical protein